MSHLTLAFDAPHSKKGGGPKADVDHGHLDVRRFSVEDGMSQPFLVSVLAASTSAELRPGDYVGRDVTFRIDTGAQGDRAWSGVVLSFDLHDVEEGGLSTYELTIAPRLALLDLRTNCRVFQRKSAPEIAEELLADWAIEAIQRLHEDHKKLEYRVQYNESDLAFFGRVLCDAGISYFFEREDGETKLVLSDMPQRADAKRKPLPFRSSSHEDTGEPHVRSIIARKTMSPAAVTIGDFDFRRPAYGLFHTAKSVDGAGGPLLEQTIYRPGIGLVSEAGGDGTTDTPAADALSTARIDEHHGRFRARAALEGQRGLEMKLQTNVSWLAPGTAFFVSGHPKLDGKRLLVTKARLAGDSTGSFSAMAVARHTDSAVRPRPVHRPVMPGVQSAVVVGAPGEEIHTDEFGRVRVQFHWDRDGSFDEKSTCWLRVAEGAAGAGFGMLSLPRAGHEVLVDFVAGSPDEPIIIGRLHGGATPSAFDLPAKGSTSGWRTRSTPGGDGFHEVSFDDTKDRELVFVRSQRDLRSVVQNEEIETVGRDRIDRIGSHLSTSVSGNDSLTAAAHSAAMGKVDEVENIKEMGEPAVASTLTLREMVPGRITLTTGGTTVQLIDDEIFLVADGTLKINGKLVDIQGGPFVHVNPPAQAKVKEVEESEKEGHVVWFELKDKNKKPIPNLECHIELANGQISHLQKTDGQGRVLFHVDEPGAYNLIVGKKAEAPAPKGAQPTAFAAKAAPPPPEATAAKKPSLAGNKTLRINKAGLKLIKKSEGFRSAPYIDPVGIPTIGYGTTVYPNGRKVSMSDASISEATATKYLKRDCRTREAAVREMVKVPLNVNQFSALVSFAYNVGTGALQSSTLLKKLNARNYNGAASEFKRWNKGTVNGQLVVLPGLTIRRAAERKLFKKPVTEKPTQTPVAGSPSGGVQAPSGKAASAGKALKVGSTAAKPAPRAKMTKHTVPLETKVSSPKGSEKLTIKAGGHPGMDPSMPRIKLKASATLGGEPISEGTFRWQLWISGRYKTRAGTKEYHLLAGQARTEPGAAVNFKLAPPSVVGGNLMVKVHFEHPQLGTVQMKAIKGIKVLGKNPTKAHIQALIQELEPDLGWLLFPIIEQESRYRQFKAPSKVLVGKPAGIGISQRDPMKSEWGKEKLDPGEPNAFFPRIYWDWKENVRAGVELFKEKERAARRHLDNLQKKHDLPPYSKGMLAREALRRYNGGVEFGAADGDWKIDPRTKSKPGSPPLPAGRRRYVDEVVARINAADIPDEFADITTKEFA
jgi:type VI secretion system secreted protein VgrG